MTRRGVVLIWLFALVYTGYVVALAWCLPAWLGDVWGIPLALGLSFAPLFIGSLVMVGR